MPTTTEATWTPPTSDAAVRAKTGKTWAEWLAVLDAAGARALDHQAIAVLLHEQHGLPGWWAQTVTVGYEQARGRRVKNETATGDYQVGGSRIVAVPVATLYAAWVDETRRALWLADPAITIRKATPEKSLRLTWVDGQTHVEINFYAKGADRSQVTVNHRKLPDADAAAVQKAYWATQLDRLKALLAG